MFLLLKYLKIVTNDQLFDVNYPLIIKLGPESAHSLSLCAKLESGVIIN